jgi:hypothetical protein
MSAREALALGAPCAVAQKAGEETNADEASPACAGLLCDHVSSLAIRAVTIVVIVNNNLRLLLLLLHHHWLGSHHHGLGHHNWLLDNHCGLHVHM